MQACQLAAAGWQSQLVKSVAMLIRLPRSQSDMAGDRSTFLRDSEGGD